MTLNRAIAHIRNQNWMASAIELVIVIFGVFIGIQVSNWNQQRVADKQSQLFTERLKTDLRDEAFSYQYLIEYNRDVRGAAERTVNALSGKLTLSNEQLLINAYRATQYKQPMRFRATYDELISTGNIDLIKDEKLRLLAMRIYNVPTLDAIAQEGVQSHYREAFRMTLENAVQSALKKQCGDRYVARGDYKAIRSVIDYPCALDLPQAEIDEAAQALRSNPLFIPYLRVRIEDIGTRLVDMTSNNRDVLQGLDAFAKKKP